MTEDEVIAGYGTTTGLSVDDAGLLCPIAGLESTLVDLLFSVLRATVDDDNTEESTTEDNEGCTGATVTIVEVNLTVDEPFSSLGTILNDDSSARVEPSNDHVAVFCFIVGKELISAENELLFWFVERAVGDVTIVDDKSCKGTGDKAGDICLFVIDGDDECTMENMEGNAGIL